jgi:1-piperideine-2-carboxylate/1-pyrroline-2-carboxylate reductase [NAD(P)H]
MGQRARNEIHAPGRQVVAIDPESVLLGMPAIGADLGVTKVITVHERNPRHGLPAIQGEVIVFDAGTGRRLALLDGPTVTKRRTAAVTLLGIETLAAHRPASVMVIGTGVQARAHIEALIDYFGVGEFWIAGRERTKASRLADEVAAHNQVAVRPVTTTEIQESMPPVDVVIALTTAQRPVVPDATDPRTLVIGVGAFKPHMAELPRKLLHSRQIFVDDYDGARHEAGDLIQAEIDWTAVRELATRLDGQRPNEGAAPVFKTVGQAAWDLAAARVAVQGHVA